MSNGTQELSATTVPAPAAQVHVGLEGPARTLAVLANVAVPLVIWFGPWGLEPRAQHALALMSLVLIGWMTHILEPAITGLIGIYLAWALSVVSFPVAFGGFANTTPWFLFGAMLFGAMATKSGL